MSGRMPVLLDKRFKPVRPLRPSRMSANVNLTPLTTVSMILGKDEDAPSARDWVSVPGMTPGESLGLFRVTAVASSYGKEHKVSLEHGIVTLQDDITNDDQTFTGSLQSIVGEILALQSTRRWALGTAPADGSHTLDANRRNLLQTLIDALKLAPGYGLTYDFSTTPWTVNVVRLPTVAGTECRVTRNMAGVTVTVDDSDLCTRAVSAALPGGRLDADTVGAWGVVAKDLGIPDDTEADEATAYAQAYLDDRKNPTVSVEIDGLFLAGMTGEPLDRFRIGELCRVSLPEWKTFVNERIISMRIDDLLRAPERVRVTLCTKPRDSSQTLSKLRRDSGNLDAASRRHGTGIGGLTQNLTVLHDEFEGMNRELGTYKNSVRIELDAAGAEIRLLAEQEADTRDRMSRAGIKINGAASEVKLFAEKTETDALGNRLDAAESSITVNSDNISLKVSKNGVISAINQTAEEVKISAGKINLEGYVTATQLSAVKASVDNIKAGVSTFTALNVDGGISANAVQAQNGEFTNLTAWNDGAVATRNWVTGKGYATQAWVNDKRVFDSGAGWHYHTFVNKAGNDVSAYFWEK